MAESIDYSRTERIVLVIDLHPLFILQNPTDYLTAVIASVKRILNFTPLCNSLFAYKLFFSSLSPLRSASAVYRLLPNPALTSLSFDGHSQTFISLTEILGSLSISSLSEELSNARPLASNTAGSLLQLVHDYAWESDLGNLEGKGTKDFLFIRSNLVVLFSPVCCSICSLSDYVDVNVKSGVLSEYLDKFCHLFRAVNEAFANRDVHFTWVNVKYEFVGSESESSEELGLFEKGIRGLGFGFCSTDSIVLGSTLTPFRLIYPKIGIPFKFLNLTNRSEAELSLEILDVNRKPLKCNCCDLEMTQLKTMCVHKSDGLWSLSHFREMQNEGLDTRESFWGRFGGGRIKLCIKAVQRYNEGEKIQGSSSDCILVKELPAYSKKQRKDSSDEIFADRVLDILSKEINDTSNRNPVPIWQIVMSFLCREGYWALVSLSNSNGYTTLGILRPFTAYAGLISIVGNDWGRVCDSSLLDLGNIQYEVQDPCADASSSNWFVGSQTETSTSGDHETLVARKRKKNEKHLYQDLTWNSFCKAAHECSDFDLSTIYFAKRFEKNKKLKFLKCWMKQIVNNSQQYLQILNGWKSMETPKSPSFPSGKPGKLDEAVIVSCSETSEIFFNNLPKRVQDGLESGLHVQTLAEQLVKSSIHWLLQSCEKPENEQVQNPLAIDDSCQSLSAKLIKLLLKDPKEMTATDINYSSSNSCDPNSISEVNVRKYELQVFLRMEIFRLDISTIMDEPLKQKLLKQICYFLDIIQYLIEGGIHGNMTLYAYFERNIKTRYSDALEDIVKDIYSKMDLFPFGDEDDTRDLLFNSEDSSQSWRDKETHDKSEGQDMEGEMYQQKENVAESPEGITKDEQVRMLIEARARRERARRFVSFTSWIPDLQRFWAPKPLKGAKPKSDFSHSKESKRKDSQRGSCSVVCETPMAGSKRPCFQEISEGEDEKCRDTGSYSYSASKALFQDN